MNKTTKGVELINKERVEQIEKHGYSFEDDIDRNSDFQLIIAARQLCWVEENEQSSAPSGWDIDLWDYMNNKPYKKRLIIAGAFIAAELDRILMI